MNIKKKLIQQQKHYVEKHFYGRKGGKIESKNQEMQNWKVKSKRLNV